MSGVIEFTGWPKIHRLARECIITEKIDGTNAQVYITEDGDILAGSRTRWLRPEADNFGFAKWVEGNRHELMDLGPGHHFGEWFGAGIQRNYGLKEKFFTLFNVGRWHEYGHNGGGLPGSLPAPPCCMVVPVLATPATFSDVDVAIAMHDLAEYGSAMVPGFMRPEGVVLYHTVARVMFKKTFDNDEGGKG